MHDLFVVWLGPKHQRTYGNYLYNASNMRKILFYYSTFLRVLVASLIFKRHLNGTTISPQWPMACETGELPKLVSEQLWCHCGGLRNRVSSQVVEVPNVVPL